MAAPPSGQAEPHNSGQPSSSSPEDNALAALLVELRQTRLRAGQPSFRSIAKGVGWSHSTVARVFTGEAAPKWEVLEAVAAHLGGDVDQCRQLWIAAMEPVAPPVSRARGRIPEKLRWWTPSALSVGATLAAFFVIVSLQGLSFKNAFQKQAVSDILQCSLSIVAAGLWCAVLIRGNGKRALPFALGLTGWSLGQVYWLATRDILQNSIPDAPSVADICYLSLPCFVIPGLLAASPRAQRRPLARNLAAFLVVGTSALALALRASAQGSVSAAIVYSLYITADVAVLWLLVRSWRRGGRRSDAVASLAFLLLLMADAVFVSYAWWGNFGYLPYGAETGYMAYPLAMCVSAGYAFEGR